MRVQRWRGVDLPCRAHHSHFGANAATLTRIMSQPKPRLLIIRSGLRC